MRCFCFCFCFLLLHLPNVQGLKYLGDFPFEKANEMLTSPEWTRAIFVRDPQQRALSAYLDKAAYSEGYYLRMQCCKRFRPGSIEYNLINCATGTNRYTKPKPGEEHIKPTPILSFEDYVSKIVPKCPDPHWEPQASRMAPKYWETINFVGHFEHLFEDTKTLLTQIDAWEEYGANGWGTGDGQDAAIFDPGNKVTHGTKAQDKSSASQYFTPEAKRHILEYYADDYRHPVLNFTRPPARR